MEKIIHMQILLYFMAAAGAAGVIGLLAVHFTYRRILKHESHFRNAKERWLLLWEKKDRLLQKMNRFVWYPMLASAGFLALELLLRKIAGVSGNLPFAYFTMAVGVPVLLIALRVGLDFSYKDEKVRQAAFADVFVREEKKAAEPKPSKAAVRAARAAAKEAARAETKANDRKPHYSEPSDNPEQEKMLDQIAEGIRQTAAADSRFKRKLSPEETEIMKEIIREFMT